LTETLLQGDCLKLLPTIQDNSIDLILADLPYGGMTENKWDIVIPLKPLFEQYQRIIKDHGAVLLFGMGKFGASLIMNAPKKMPYRYEWIWQKTMPVGFLNCRKMPLRAHENIYVFYKHLPTYNPQMRQGFRPYESHESRNKGGKNYVPSGNYNLYKSKGDRFPVDVITFSNGNNHYVHPTQKPVPLLQYLIKTYTDEGMTVLDNCMGSGSTGVAAKQLNRNFIGMELDKEYFEIAKERIKEA
jgi:DNA modification methylase